MPKTDRDKSFERLYQLALQAAKSSAGGERACSIIGSTYATALVRAEILGIVFGMDEITKGDTVRDFINYASARTNASVVGDEF